MNSLTVALTGNPNCGKTSLFNALTGARQHVGNWPGVTVERKEGTVHRDGVTFHVVDLPGTYSLRSYSAEERVARDYIIGRRPDVVVNIVDCSNLERHLYLTSQLLELGVPMVVALNMWDMAQAQRILIDVEMLSGMLGVTVVPTVGTSGQGLEDVLQTAVKVAGDPKAALADRRWADCGNELEPHVQELSDAMVLELLLAPSPDLRTLLEHRRHLACQLLAGDAHTIQLLRSAGGAAMEKIIDKAARFAAHVERTMGQGCDLLLAQRRYGFISGLLAQAVRRPPGLARSRSDRIDAVVTHPWLGLPIFALTMYLVFQITFWIGNPLVDLLESGKEALAAIVRSSLNGPSTHLLGSLLADGVIGGVGAVAAFLPLILLLYLAIAALEDSGYMARAAFVLDRLMHRIGLHGKSFIPMVIGFGCTVPALMATRILETRRDRLTTMLVVPLISCGARLPVYVLLLGALFPPRAALSVGGLTVTNQALLLFGIYVTGIVLAVLCAKLLRTTIFRGEVTPLVIELPPYRRPTARSLVLHSWERGWQYLRKAGTVILAIVVVLWAAQTWPSLPADQRAAFQRERTAASECSMGVPLMSSPFPAASFSSSERQQQKQQQKDMGKMPMLQQQQNASSQIIAQIDAREHQAQLMNSVIGRVGLFVAPVLKPCGLDWRVATALIGALGAKEVFVGQMGVIYASGDDAAQGPPAHGGKTRLRQKIARDYTPMQGLCMMLLVLIASPCAATVAVTARESGTWKWAAFQWTYLTVLAWIVAMCVYQIGRATGLGS